MLGVDFKENYLSMLGKSFVFKDISGYYDELKAHGVRVPEIGLKRVVSIVVNEDKLPEVGLADSKGSDEVEYYPLDQLSVTRI